ncbi:NADH dehydrogenase, FAD-containing subunit [Gulbenkiania indica]|uniref:NADH dehydrogenase, FAD-containing subunit n=1 Tax=Gulbenkiania indica TaxID=375574 RepID=A0A0K6H4H6_9NEIS|nr:NAD(P)/FAD-dependent oxidoreductase [Gulbenkiania indica]CUA85727.1 NADH dehydrogenase, FAD-containing subunit [Gulbenkiania indica]
MTQTVPHIVIVGGGAGGLVLATRLSHRLGRRQQARITLVDAERTHVWKPVLHQLAAGSYDSHAEEIEYLAHARWHGFTFRQGSLAGLDRARREVVLAPLTGEDGSEVLPERRLEYDLLVLAVGSQTNDFGTPGVAEHAIRLDTPATARRFHERLIDACLRAQNLPPAPGRPRMAVTLIGGGATGVELAAELHEAAKVLASYGLDRVDPDADLTITVVEASDRILAALPPRLSEAARRELAQLQVQVLTGERVTEVGPDFVALKSGKVLPSTVTVWAAGVKAPPFLHEIGGLETNKLNQLVVQPTMQSTRDPAVFALGDCAACPLPDGSWAPARAQSAYQQALQLADNIERFLKGRPLHPYVFRDRGSLVSLAGYSSVGSLMGSLSHGSLFIEGQIAKWMYWMLHKRHQMAVSGVGRMLLITLTEMIDRVRRPRIKLH